MKTTSVRTRELALQDVRYQAQKRHAEELQRNLQIVKNAGCKTIPDFLEVKRVQWLARGIKH
jgi:hypothetical protein